MAEQWCNRMESAAEGHIDNVCEGHATVRIEYATPAMPGEWVTYLCDACGMAIREDSRVTVLAVRRLV